MNLPKYYTVEAVRHAIEERINNHEETLIDINAKRNKAMRPVTRRFFFLKWKTYPRSQIFTSEDIVAEFTIKQRLKRLERKRNALEYYPPYEKVQLTVSETNELFNH